MLQRTILIISSLILAACASGISSDPYQTTVNDKVINKAVPPLYLGQTFIVKLPSSPGTNHHWIPVNVPNAILVQQGESTYQLITATADVDEAPSIESLTFKAVQIGTQRLRLEYRRPWDIKSAKKEVFYDIEVK